MPEYLAPGVYVEETSYRSKSIEGVSTTTTGFVGPTRYGPIDIAPEVVTSMPEFERAYGNGNPFQFGGDFRGMHNYVWHAVRSFFEEGGKRVYVARVFRPAVGNYAVPAPKLEDDNAQPTSGRYLEDGHARYWLTRGTAAVNAAAAAISALGDRVHEAIEHGEAAARVAMAAAQVAADEPAGSAKRIEADAKTLEEEGKVLAALAQVAAAEPKAHDLAIKAKQAFAASTIDLAATRQAREQAVDAADAATVEDANGAILRQAVTDARDKAVAAHQQVGSIAGTAAALAPLGDLDAGQKSLAEALEKLCRTDGKVEKAAKAARDAAEAAKVLADDAAASPGNAAKRAAALAAARILPLAAVAAQGIGKEAETAGVALATGTSAVPAGPTRNAIDAATTAAAGLKALLDSAAAAAKAAAEADISAAVRKDAATDANGAALALETQLPVVKGKATAVRNLNGIPADLKTQATALETHCGAGGVAETALQNLKAAAIVSLNAATAASGSPQDNTLRAAAVVAARKVAQEARVALDKAAAAVRLADALRAQAERDRPNLATDVVATLDPALAEATLETAKLLAQAEKAHAAALHSVYPRGYAALKTVAALDALGTTFAALSTAAATAVAGAVAAAPTADHTDALLLRARFPGEAGNLVVRFSLRLGQNALAPDGTRSKVPGLQPNDFVWVGKGAPNAQGKFEGRLLVARLNAAQTDFYFSEDGNDANAEYWLNQPQPPSPGATKLDPNVHVVRLSTVTVTVFPPEPQASSTAWEGLAMDPQHKRSGAADSLTEKFRAAPASATDARLLPFVLLAHGGIRTATPIYRTLFNAPSSDLTLESLLENPRPAEYLLAGGNDGLRPGAGEYKDMGGGAPDDPKMGLKALEDLEDISIVAAPGSTFGFRSGFTADARTIVGDLIGHASRMKYRIAVLDSGDGQSISEVRAMRAKYDSTHAALYYPWVRVLDPITRTEISLPPSGFVTGIYARNDIDRAVFKAPANEVVRGAVGFEALLNKAQQDVLNPEGVNCFRFFEGRGFRLWGARTISSDPEWKYVNVRRYFAYLERSIDRGTQWAVFEPNGEALWANVRRTIEDFLFNEWQNGALLGEKPEKAYFVKCDRSTMSQNDLDNGRLVCLIGVAPLKPAEFVIFRIGQWTADRKI